MMENNQPTLPTHELLLPTQPIYPPRVEAAMRMQEEYGYAQIKEQSEESLAMLARRAPSVARTHSEGARDPFFKVRQGDHMGEFTPPTGLFYYSNSNYDEPLGGFSGWAKHVEGTDADGMPVAEGFCLDGQNWQTVEHYYQASRFFQTAPDIAAKIQAAKTPFVAKKRSHKQENLPNWRQDWVQVRELYMLRAHLALTQSHPGVVAVLEGTGDATLVEDAYSDNIWGRGPEFRGQNLLGRTWMLTRNIRRAGDTRHVLDQTANI